MKKLRNNFAVSSLLMVSPLAAVLLIFLVLPIVLIVVVSFWRATEFSIIPAFEFDNYEFLVWVACYLYSIFQHLQIRLDYLDLHSIARFHCRLLSGFSHPHADLASRVVLALYNPVLDQQYNPDDIMDPVSGPKWDSQLYTHIVGRD